MDSSYTNHEHDISKSEADKRIKVFLAIRNEIREKVLNSSIAASLSPQAKAYLESPFLSFAFFKEQLDDLFSSVPDANGFRVYLAAAPSPTPPNDKPAHGSPTSVIYACKFTPTVDGKRSVTNQIPSNEAKAALQHPCPGEGTEDPDDYDAAADSGECDS